MVSTFWIATLVTAGVTADGGFVVLYADQIVAARHWSGEQ